MTIRRSGTWAALAILVALWATVEWRVAAQAPAGLTPDYLRCEYLVDPLGVDVERPRLSWVPQSTDAARRGQRQTAYQILVAGSVGNLQPGQADLWDSGKVDSDRTIQVAYAGKPLGSRMRCYWKVRLWDEQDRPSAWSEPALWSMGLLDPSDWGAQWISDPREREIRAAAKPHNGYHSLYTNQQDEEKWVAIDLGKVQPVDAVQLHPARPFDWHVDVPGFLFPLRFKVELATKPDFSDARVVVDRTAEDFPNPKTEAPLFRFEPNEARYVRLRVTRLRRRDGDSYAMALAEMQVFSQGRNLAQGARVTAKDSIEVSAWSKAKLVDGRLESDRNRPPVQPATMLRKPFSIDGPIRQATVYVTGLGLYELEINGRRVGDHQLAPEWTDYRSRIQYQVFDVTDLVRSGENAIGATLAEGWYAGPTLLQHRRDEDVQRLLLRLDVELSSGPTRTIISNSTWRSTTDGPIRFAGIYDGENYDARQEMPGWSEPGFDDSTWRRVHAEPRFSDARLVWQPNEPIRVIEDRPAISRAEPKPGVYVYDLGQNMVGWCRVKMRLEAGKTATIRYAEMRNDDGTIYTANLREAAQTDRYTGARDAEVVYEPRFTYHGFRYVEISGVSQPPAREAVVGRVVHSAAPETGDFETSSSFLNQLMSNVVWSQRGNMHGVPTDCPQRNERLGWMGDIQAFAQTAIFNRDMAAFFTKWVRDIRDAQLESGRYPDMAPHPMAAEKGFAGAPGWADAGTVVPWRLYQNYGDERMLREHFDSARRWVDYVHEHNPDLLWENVRGNDYNDWLNSETLIHEGWPKPGGAVPNTVFATAFFAHSSEIVSKMAAVIGKQQEAQHYRELFEQIKAAFQRAYVTADGRVEGDTQAGYALALDFDLLPEELRQRAARHMADSFERFDGHLSTGIQTTHRLMLALARYGYQDEAYRVVQLRSFPSWGFMIDNGATTIWERWDGYVEGRGFQNAYMNSFNHWAFGSVAEWMWRDIAGINPDEAAPAFQHFVVRPRPGGGLTYARGTYRSIRGPISSRWRIADGKLTLEVRVPPNTSATVYVPAKDPRTVQEGGKPLSEAVGVVSHQAAEQAAVVRVGSGNYSFTAPY